MHSVCVPVDTSSANKTSFGLQSARSTYLKVTGTPHTSDALCTDIHSNQLLLMYVNSPHEVLCGCQPLFLHSSSVSPHSS